MRLDERIKFFEQEANEMEQVADTGVCMNGIEISSIYADDTECIERHIERLQNNVREYRQIAEWLKDYKRLLEQTRWIAVSKGLPKENGWYQCTVIFYDALQTMELFYKNGEWLDNRRIDMFNTYDIYGYGNTKEKHKLSYQELFSEFDWTENVIAWKPLLQPYKKESENEQ